MAFLIAIIGLVLITKGAYLFWKAFFLLFKCGWIYLFSTREQIDEEFEKVLKEGSEEYRSFSRELEEMLKD